MNDQFLAALNKAGVNPQPSNGSTQAFGNQGAAVSALDSVTTGTTRAGLRGVIGGLEKIGKTTLLATAPRTLIIPTEMGFGGMTVAKTKPIQSFGELMATLTDIENRAAAGTFPYLTLGLDTVTAVEQLIHAHVVRSDPKWQHNNGQGITMESALGGYGKAYLRANELFLELLALLDRLAFYGGINVIFTAHVFASKMADPMNGEYDQWDILLHSPKNNKTYGKREILTQWADLIGFLHEPMFVTKGEGNSNFAQGTSLNRGRMLAVDRTPAYVAGNRFGLTGSIPIPLEGGWNAVAHAIYNAKGLDYFNRDN